MSTKKMAGKRFIVNLIVAVSIGAVFFFGVYVGKGGLVSVGGTQGTLPVNVSQPEGVDFTPLWDAWHILESDFVGTGDELPNQKERLWGAISGLTASFRDPFTVFLPPQIQETFSEDIRGNFSGVGMNISQEDSAIVVIAPLEGTPADRAGILPGDLIIAIDGETTFNVSIDEAVRRIRGERGTEVILSIVREGADEILEIVVTRDNIEIPTTDTELLDGDIFLLRLFNFSGTAPTAFRNGLREFAESKSNKLIIDLRGNPGGFLNGAVDITSWFLPTGKVVVREVDGRGGEVVHRSKGYDVFKESFDLQMVVLVDVGSASASEIVAGALRDHGIAVLVGQTTFGKGSVQQVVDITDDTALRLTVAHWLTPNGVSISKEGLVPDVEVVRTFEDLELGKDPQLEKAVELLGTSF